MTRHEEVRKIDGLIEFVLFKLYGVQVRELSALIGKDVARRVRVLQQKGYVENKQLIPDEKALVILKQKGLTDLVNRPEYSFLEDSLAWRKPWNKSAMLAEHVRGEALIATWLALPKKDKSIHEISVPFGFQYTERDLNNSGKATGIHTPDGMILAKTTRICIEYERTMKSKGSRTHLKDNMEANAERFSRQYWFVENRAYNAVRELSELHPTWHVYVIKMDLVRADLGRYEPNKNLIGKGQKYHKAVKDLPRLKRGPKSADNNGFTSNS